MQNRGLIHASYQAALRQKMNVISHNLANLGTKGFKARALAFKECLNQLSGEDGLSFVQVSGVFKNFAQGGFEPTNNAFDIALQGEGFFRVQTPEGTAYSRNGQLTLNTSRQLVTADGKTVLDQGNAPITIPQEAGNIKITSTGEVLANGNTVGQLSVVTFPNLQELNDIGNGLYTTTQAPQPIAKTKVIQGALEQSNVSPILELTNLIETHRAYERASYESDNEDERNQKTADVLGKPV